MKKIGIIGAMDEEVQALLDKANITKVNKINEGISISSEKEIEDFCSLLKKNKTDKDARRKYNEL